MPRLAATPSRDLSLPASTAGEPMKQSSVSIPYVLWRDERPRFAPGPGLQALGYKSRDLKHPNGTWFTFAEARAESERIRQEAAGRKATAALGRRLGKVTAPPAGRTLSQLCEAVFDLPEFSIRPQAIGRREIRVLAAKTIWGYGHNKTWVERACTRIAAKSGAETIWHAPAGHLTPEMIQAVIHDIHEVSGLSSARAARAFLSQMWNRLGSKEPGANRNLFDDLETMAVPQGRVNPWEPQEFWAMVTAAETIGRPEMADSFFWAALHGYRQTDRLTQTTASLEGDHITVRFSKMKNKTQAFATLKVAGVLRQRHDAALARRKSAKVDWPQLLIDEKIMRPWNPKGDWYRHVFEAVRTAATATCPSCARLTDQDLRDTNQTWLDRCAVDPEIMAISAGHSTGRKLSAIQRRHYVAVNQLRLDAAFDMLHAYLLKHRPTSLKQGETSA